MPATPETWLGEFIANAGNTTGTQFEPQIVQLANGNILVAWTDDTNNADIAPGDDIIGQIFDPLGNIVGAPIHLNAGFFFFDDENQFELAALPNGGFVVVYEDEDVNGVGIRSAEFDATGANTAHRTILADPGAIVLNDPSVAVAANGDYLVTFQRDNAGDIDTYVSLVDVSVGTQSPPVIGLASSNVSTSGTTQANATAALSNGNFVIVTRRGGADADITARLIDPAGTPIGAFFTVGGTNVNGDEDFGADVVALTGGGFVVAWSNTDASDTDILFQRYDNAGVAQGGAIPIAAGALTDNNNELSMAALADGGFVVVWDDDEADTISGQRYSAAGATVGASFTVSGATGVETGPEVIGFADGRFAVTWAADGDVHTEIFDTRDFVNDPAVYAPDEWQVGTVGDDVFTSDSSADFVHGWDGDDTITALGITKDYYGDAGNDRINATTSINSDLYDGGTGIDTIDWLAATGIFLDGATFDLALGTATDGVNTEVMVNFENLNGTDNADRIIGAGGANILRGNGGNDTINGGFGGDELIGGDGDDALRGQDGNDDLFGNAGDDTLFGGNGADAIDGGAGSDYVNGNAGNDTIFGRTENDTLFGGGDRDAISGGDGNDLIYGQAGHDDLGAGLAGNEGDDLINGGGGNDLVNGHDGDDQLYGGADNDVLNGGANEDFMHGGTGNDTLNGQGQGDTMYGYHGVDTLNGGDGDDRLNGGDGNDTLRGGNNADILTAADGDDDLWGDAGNDRFNFGDGWGNDVIHDFADNGLEKISFASHTAISGLADLDISDFGGGALVVFGASSIHVLGLTAADLGDADFIF